MTSLAGDHQTNRLKRATSITSGQAGRQRAVTKVPEADLVHDGSTVAEEHLAGLADVLNDQTTAPGQANLTEAPILGDKLLQVVEGGEEGKGAASVQSLQAQVEAVRTELEEKFHEVEERFRRRWYDINFDEVEIEEDFRSETFDGQRKYMYATMVLLTVYYFVCILVLDAAPLLHLRQNAPMNVSAATLTCFLDTNTTLIIPPVGNGTDYERVVPDVQPLTPSQLRRLSYPVERLEQWLVEALAYRCTSVVLLLFITLCLKFASRKFTLGALIIVRRARAPFLMIEA